jgi:hypothetical protein
VIVALDHWIFGSGHGMATPTCDGRFYWLSGELYHFSPGLGAQLTSYQWTKPAPHEQRVLGGYAFRPLHSHRRWGRVEVSWATVLPDDLTNAHAFLRDMERSLGHFM